VIVVLDEAYIEFVRDPECPNGFDEVRSGTSSVVVLRTFSKAYGLAGVRIGYGVMAPQVADYLNRVRQPFNTTTLSQVAALAALDDDEFLAKTRETVWSGLAYLYGELKRLQLPYVPTQTNFVLIEVPLEARLVFEAMLRRGVIIRSMASYGLKSHVRINVGLPEENLRCMQALEQVLIEMGVPKRVRLTSRPRFARGGTRVWSLPLTVRPVRARVRCRGSWPGNWVLSIWTPAPCIGR